MNLRYEVKIMNGEYTARYVASKDEYDFFWLYISNNGVTQDEDVLESDENYTNTEKIFGKVLTLMNKGQRAGTLEVDGAVVEITRVRPGYIYY